MKEAEKKAEELISKFVKITNEHDFYEIENPLSIQCALVAVDEIIKATPMYKGIVNPEWSYWQEVKKQIVKH